MNPIFSELLGQIHYIRYQDRFTNRLSFSVDSLFIMEHRKNAAAGYQDQEDPSQVLGCP